MASTLARIWVGGVRSVTYLRGMPTPGEYRSRLRRRRLAAALLLAPVAGLGMQAARQRLRERDGEPASDAVPTDADEIVLDDGPDELLGERNADEPVD
jgi:hypothetical protein